MRGPKWDTSAESSEEEDETYISKNGRVCWSSVAMDEDGRGRISAEYILRTTPGPTRLCTSRAKDILSTFQIFIPATIENIIINMSNLEGTRKFGNEWKKITQLEFQAYMGLLLLAGVFKSYGESMDSLWSSRTGRAIFAATMSQQRFRELTQILRFDDRQKRLARKSTDKLAAIREVWDLWANNLPLLYNLGVDVTIDERLFPFKGRCQFRQYMPREPGKYGIKFWVACDAKSHYCWRIQAYTGKPAVGEREKDIAERVVLELSEGLRGHNITIDNFFTSFHLGQELLKKKITMIGTVHRSRPELPPALLACKGRQVHSSKFAFAEKTSIVSYLAKKQKIMLLMSTFHRKVEITNRHDCKPQIVIDYNKTKGGVDTMDQQISKYTTRRKTRTLAPGDLLQHGRHYSAQCLHSLERDQSWVEGRHKTEAQALPTRARGSPGKSLH